MAGDRDPITPMAFSEEIARCLPEDLVRFERFAGCGHGVQADDPVQAFAVLREFIGSGQQPPPATPEGPVNSPAD